MAHLLCYILVTMGDTPILQLYCSALVKISEAIKDTLLGEAFQDIRIMDCAGKQGNLRLIGSVYKIK